MALSEASSIPRFVYVAGGYSSDGIKTDDGVVNLLHEGDGYSQTKILASALTGSN